MNDNVLRIRLPSSLADRLKQTANDYGRSGSDIVREGLVRQLRRLQDDGSNHEPPQAA